MPTEEHRIKAKVKQALAGIGYIFMPVPQGLQAAALDYFCCFDGRFVAVETKTEGKRLTLRQVTVARAIAAAGGMVFVVRGMQDILAMLDIVRDRNHAAEIHDSLGSENMYGEFWCK